MSKLETIGWIFGPDKKTQVDLRNKLLERIQNYLNRFKYRYGNNLATIESDKPFVILINYEDKMVIGITIKTEDENKVAFEVEEYNYKIEREIKNILKEIWADVLELNFDIEIFDRKFKKELDRYYEYYECELNEYCIEGAIHDFVTGEDTLSEEEESLITVLFNSLKEVYEDKNLNISTDRGFKISIVGNEAITITNRLNESLKINIFENEHKVVLEMADGSWSNEDIEEIIDELWGETFYNYKYDIEIFGRSFKYELEQIHNRFGEVEEDISATVYKLVTGEEYDWEDDEDDDYEW